MIPLLNEVMGTFPPIDGNVYNAVKLLPKVFAKLQKDKGKDHSGELGILAKAVELELSSNNLEKVKL